jgi:3-carboxy-cis,cis-muconate cycloisomerase
MVSGFAGGMSEVFSPRRRLECLLAFEAALARALARAGVTTTDAAAVVVASCAVDAIDVARIERDAVSAGNEAIPLIEQLRGLVARTDRTAANVVHYGATSQDAIDTALMLQLRDAIALFDRDVGRLASALADLAIAEADTPMAARTWMQHAIPTTFGFKVAGWLDGIVRAHSRIRALCDGAIALQFGGAAGTLAALGPLGPDVARSLSDELGLPLPVIAWHATRDRVGEVATTLGLLSATLGKIARDLSLLMQTEVDEVREPSALAGSGRSGRSSTMPQKRNPVRCAAILSAAVRMPGLVAAALAEMVQEHERALGGWQAEWATIPQICELAFDALEHTTVVVAGLEVNRDRMAANLEMTHGLLFAEAVTFALAAAIGRQAAADVTTRSIRRATEEGRHLRDVLVDDDEVCRHLSPASIDGLFDPRRYLGVAARAARQVADSAILEIGSDRARLSAVTRR